MKLYEAIGVKEDKKECIAIVGAGGKTSTLFRLSKELSGLGSKVIATTTTKIYMPKASAYGDILVAADKAECMEFAEKAAAPGIYVLGKSVLEDNKLEGLECSYINDLYAIDGVDYVIAEADGAKRKPVKAPAEHEPVIPECATIVIGVIGLDALGKPVNDENVHRVEEFCKICECSIGDIINEDMLISLIEHPDGLFKGTPAGCKRVVMLNKAEGSARIEAAKKIKKALAEKENMEVLCTSLLKEECSIAAVILAAGKSTRMGEQKLLMPLGDETLLEKVIEQVSRSGMFKDIVLVYSNDVVQALAEEKGLQTVLNPHPESGLSSSIKLGLEKLYGEYDAFMFFSGDQPFINEDMLSKLTAAYMEEKECIIVPKYGETSGMPTIFPKEFRQALLELEGDVGGRVIIKDNPDKVRFIRIEQQEAGFDIDTKEDYQKALIIKENKL